MFFLFCRHYNNPVSAQCELELNLIENEQYNLIGKDYLSTSNVQAISHSEIENLTCSPQNGSMYFITIVFTCLSVIKNIIF